MFREDNAAHATYRRVAEVVCSFRHEENENF